MTTEERRASHPVKKRSVPADSLSIYVRPVPFDDDEDDFNAERFVVHAGYEYEDLKKELVRELRGGGNLHVGYLFDQAHHMAGPYDVSLTKRKGFQEAQFAKSEEADFFKNCSQDEKGRRQKDAHTVRALKQATPFVCIFLPVARFVYHSLSASLVPASCRYCSL